MNKYQEILDLLDKLYETIGESIDFKETSDLQIRIQKAIELFEEISNIYIPITPIYLYDENLDCYTECCPKCQLSVDDNFCKNCSQAIDWSKDE